jgi:hypothetical protein
MGSFLIFESMLETVLYARDRYLKEVRTPRQCITHAHAPPHTPHTHRPYAKRGTIVQDGKMYPAIARMFVAPLDMTPFFQKRIRFLRDVPDLNLAPLMYVREAADSYFPSHHFSPNASLTTNRHAQSVRHDGVHVLWHARSQVQTQAPAGRRLRDQGARH